MCGLNLTASVRTTAAREYKLCEHRSFRAVCACSSKGSPASAGRREERPRLRRSKAKNGFWLQSCKARASGSTCSRPNIVSRFLQGYTSNWSDIRSSMCGMQFAWITHPAARMVKPSPHAPTGGRRTFRSGQGLDPRARSTGIGQFTWVAPSSITCWGAHARVLATHQRALPVTVPKRGPSFTPGACRPFRLGPKPTQLKLDFEPNGSLFGEVDTKP